jgi:hypothetical protein
MRIEWGLKKQQGNSRPVFWYEIRLTPEEESLNPRIEPIHTDIPVPLAQFVNGGREEEPDKQLLRPTHLDQREDLPRLVIYGDRGRRRVVLPFRPETIFLEEARRAVEELRRALEGSLLRALSEEGFEIVESVELSDHAKGVLAPYLAKKKIFPF